jgi:hypothetical protein
MTANDERSHDLRIAVLRPEVLADLVVVRLLPEARIQPGPSQICKDLAPFFKRPPDVASVRRAIEGLREAGCLPSFGLVLTDAGRSRGLAFLGLEQWPADWTWRTLKGRVLPARALGLGPGPEVDRILQSADRLSAALLKRKLGLPVGTGGTVRATLEALVCRELGFPDLSNLDELTSAVLSRKLGSERRLSVSALERQVPRVLLGTHGRLPDLRELLLAGIAEAASARAEATGRDLELPAFAQRVRVAARDCPTGRWGPDKVFVSHVWNRVETEPDFRRMDLSSFKRRLVEANAADLLTLSRADLVQLMDPNDLRGSEISVSNAVFHFVTGERRAT